MKHLKYLAYGSFALLSSPKILLAQEGQEAGVEESSNAFGFTNFWELIGQAGWFRWFILGVLVIGLFLIFKQFFELWDDKRRASRLEKEDLSRLTVDHLEDVIVQESDHMLARLISMLLNVYRNSGVAIMLHEEMANFIQMEQERFGTFKQRVDFLSDAAGAFGLLGTVWGIFLVFSQRDLDPQNILGGMGLALITTLLGLVVSIILNLLSTEVSNQFTRRLDSVTAKADQTRFRMMKDAETSSRSIAEEWMKRHQYDAGPPAQYGNTNGHHESSRATSRASQLEKFNSDQTVAIQEQTPTKLTRHGNNQSARAGETLSRELGVQVFDENSAGISGIRVMFTVQSGGGHFPGAVKKMVQKTDANGMAKVKYILGRDPGFNRVAAQVDGVDRGLEFQAMGIEA